MAFGFPAYHECILKNKKHHSISDLLDLIKKTHFIVEGHSEDMIFIKSQVNMWSWGESIEIKLHDDLITIESKCAFPVQCVDWGKNQENVVELVAMIGLK